MTNIGGPVGKNLKKKVRNDQILRLLSIPREVRARECVKSMLKGFG